MKRLGMAVAALVFCATISFGQDLSKESFSINFDKLSSYLELAPSQMNEVSSISQYFTEKQNESFSGNPVRQEKKMQQAVYGNLKLMKKALTEDQYRKYVAILNVTNNNKQFIRPNIMDDSFLADK